MAGEPTLDRETVTSEANSPILIAWPVNGSTGWGLYGLHLAIQLKRMGRRVFLAHAPDLTGIAAPLHALLPQATDPLPDPAERIVVVSALGNRPDAPPEINLPNPCYHVGLTVFEDTGFDAADLANLRRYDRLIAPSRWCAGVLAGHGFPGISVCSQGYDDSVFHPAPRIRAQVGEPGWDDRILVFSGGKLEYRKGQDIAVAAFRLFRETHHSAVLVTAWHNPWPATMEGIWNAGHVKGVPKVVHGVADVTGWLAMNGVPREHHLDLGQVSQVEAAQAIRECDVAVFPNRAEGATNMVLAECLGLGVPCVFGEWTGQAGLDSGNMSPRGRGVVAAVKPPSRLYRGTDDWCDVRPALGAHCMESAMDRKLLGQLPPRSWHDAAPHFSALLTVPAEVTT